MEPARNTNPELDEAPFAPDALVSMFGDAHDVIAAVLDTFCASMELHLQQLKAASDAGDIASQQQIAHRIKGAARMSGALALAQAAERLECTARRAQTGTDPKMDCTAASKVVAQQWAQLPGDAAFRRARHGH
jgi:HPt (histidine-containing phosphotransfer) domain-containing protein